MLQSGSTIYLPSPQGPQKKFKVIKQLGQGGKGVVYQVQPLDLSFQGNDVAIKIQNMATENEIKFIDLLIDYQKKESQFSQDQRSQIIRIYERTQYQGNLVTIMELGQSDLYRILLYKSGFQTLNDKIKALNQMAQSIWFLHHNQLIHRDLKPEHYLKVGDEFKLIDFGLVQFNQQKVKTQNIGTTLFQAPEIKEGSNIYTEAVDIWSLGGTFYEILTESQFNYNDFNLQTLEIKVFQNCVLNQQIQNMIKALLNGMLRLKINEVKQQLTYIQNLIQQPQQIIPINFPPSFVNPFSPKPQQLPNQPNQIANQFLNQFPPAQNVFPQQNLVFEKKQVEPVAAQSSDQNSQLTNLIISMRDMFVERFDQQQKQIQNFNNSLIEKIEKNLKENLQAHMQDLNKKIELSIKENIQSQFEKIQKVTLQQQSQIIYKQEELLNQQQQQYQSLIKDIQQNISYLTQHQNGYLNNLNQNLDKNWQKQTKDISQFKEFVQNQQQVQKQMIEYKEIKRQNLMQHINEKFKDLNQLIIQQIMSKQEIIDRIEQQQKNNTVQFDQQSQCKDLNDYNLMQNYFRKFNDLIQEDQNFSQSNQQEDNIFLKLEKKDKKQFQIRQQLKNLQQQKGKIEISCNETQKQLIKNLSKPDIKKIQYKNQANEISQNEESESNDKLQKKQMNNERQSRFDKDKNQNIQELQYQGEQQIQSLSCPIRTKRFGVI